MALHLRTIKAITWRVAFLVPLRICVVVAIIDYLFATDTPHDDWLILRRQELEKSQDSNDDTEKGAIITGTAHVIARNSVELAIDNVIGNVFRTHFDLNSSTAAYIGSTFVGYYRRDTLAKRWHLSARILVHLILICLEGIFLVEFNFVLNTNLPSAIVLMVLFSFFVQAVCGSTFRIVLFVDPLNNGKVM
ncbi:hypothetical protein INT45_010537 [Circinella minor]|uniref:Uncharacterized protein n=1 Tax=Circinella minor TaxID=1195481 RepID=A0A8H7S8C3_9FUNG|nr:hypothetical protein INT45_010537 [Circinella minor]